MTKNTLVDVNNHLIAELERLGDESLVGEALEQEVRRADAISKVAKQATANTSILLRALQLAAAIGARPGELPGMLTGRGVAQAKANGERQ